MFLFLLQITCSLLWITEGKLLTKRSDNFAIKISAGYGVGVDASSSELPKSTNYLSRILATDIIKGNTNQKPKLNNLQFSDSLRNSHTIEKLSNIPFDNSLNQFANNIIYDLKPSMYSGNIQDSLAKSLFPKNGLIKNNQYLFPHTNSFEYTRNIARHNLFQTDSHQKQLSNLNFENKNMQPVSQPSHSENIRFMEKTRNYDKNQAIHVVNGPQFQNNRVEMNQLFPVKIASVYSSLTPNIPFQVSNNRHERELNGISSNNVIPTRSFNPLNSLKYNLRIRNLILKDPDFLQIPNLQYGSH